MFDVERLDADGYSMRPLHGRHLSITGENNKVPGPGRHRLHLDNFHHRVGAVRRLPKLARNPGDVFSVALLLIMYTVQFYHIYAYRMFWMYQETPYGYLVRLG